MQGIRNEFATQRGSRSLQDRSIDRAVLCAAAGAFTIFPSKKLSCSADPAEFQHLAHQGARMTKSSQPVHLQQRIISQVWH